MRSFAASEKELKHRRNKAISSSSDKDKVVISIMSVKEFFAFANIKLAVIEFLKSKADFENLHEKYKKPFRALLNKH